MSTSIQERQLILNESLSNQLKAVLHNQEELRATTDELKRQNMELTKALAEAKAVPERSGRKRRRQSEVVVPEHLRVSIRFDTTILFFITLFLCPSISR